MPPQLIRECHRVLKPGGTGIFMVYNRVSWLNALSKVMKVALEHEDAPVLKKYSIGGVQGAAEAFDETRIVPERFPGEVTPSQGMEGRGVQHDVRRHVQRAAAIVGAAARLAPDGVLQEMTTGTEHETRKLVSGAVPLPRNRVPCPWPVISGLRRSRSFRS